MKFLMIFVLCFSFVGTAQAVIISPVAEGVGYDGDAATFSADGTIESFVTSPSRLEWQLLDQTVATFPQTRRSVIEFPLAGLADEAFVTLSLKHAGFTGGSSLRVHGYSGNGTLELADFNVNNPIAPELDDNILTIPDYGKVMRTIDVTSFVHSLQLSAATHAGFLLLSENPAVGTNGGTEIFTSEAANPLLAPTLVAGNGQKIVFDANFGGENQFNSNNLNDWGFSFETVSGNGLVEVVDDPLVADNKSLQVFDPTGEIVRAKAILPVADLGETLDLAFTYAFLTPGQLDVSLGGNNLTSTVSLGDEDEYSLFDQSINILGLPFLDTVNIDGIEYTELILEFSNLPQEDQFLRSFGLNSSFGEFGSFAQLNGGSMWLLDEFNALSNASIVNAIPEPNCAWLLGFLLIIVKNVRRNKK